MRTRARAGRIALASVLSAAAPAAVTPAAAVAQDAPADSGEARGPTLRIGLLETTDAVDGRRMMLGVEFGLEEAGRTASLLAGRVEVVATGTASAPGALAAAARAGRIAAIVGGATEQECRTMSALAASARVVWINTLCPLEPPAPSACSATTFHIATTDAMRRDARRIAEGADDAEVLLWDASLERYGAAQLSERFQRRAGRPMGSAEWAGWTSVKVLWDAASQARDSTAAALAEVLASPAFSFDAHKGRPLGFRPRDRRLRQPLYVRTSEEVLMEVPRLSRGTSAREALEALGDDGPVCRPAAR